MTLSPPPIVFQGRRWSSDELSAIAGAWWDALGERFRDSAQPVAMALANQPEAVALFFALSACRAPLILLPPDPKSWRTDPPIPAGTRLVLTPAQERFAAEAAPLGLAPSVLPAPATAARDRAPAFLTCPGIVFFTSGSTGLPRPVYRTTASLVEASRAVTTAAAFPPDTGVIAALPLDRSYGMNNGLIAATVLGRPMALLERFEHNALLAFFASGEYHYWAGSPVMADVLNRHPLSGHHPAPAVCVFAGRLSAPVYEPFRERFGVSLRQLYGTTEALTVCADLSPDGDARFETAGRPLPGVDVLAGDDPGAPLPAGEPGRLWVRSAWMMDGYGFPPRVERGDMVGDWWPSPDRGRVDADGSVVILGRLDDTIRTGTGHVVNPAEVAAVLERFPGVTDVVAVPLESPSGPILGVLVESAEPLRSADLRAHLARAIPPWSRPRVLETVRALPRLSTGRTDRRACIEILGRALRRSPAR